MFLESHLIQDWPRSSCSSCLLCRPSLWNDLLDVGEPRSTLRGSLLFNLLLWLSSLRWIMHWAFVTASVSAGLVEFIIIYLFFGSGVVGIRQSFLACLRHTQHLISSVLQSSSRSLCRFNGHTKRIQLVFQCSSKVLVIRNERIGLSLSLRRFLERVGIASEDVTDFVRVFEPSSVVVGKDSEALRVSLGPIDVGCS